MNMRPSDNTVLTQVLRAQTQVRQLLDPGSFTVVAPDTAPSLGLGHGLGNYEDVTGASLQHEFDMVHDILALHGTLIKRNAKPIRLSLESSPDDGYLIDYDGKFEKYFEEDGGGWKRWHKENPKAHSWTRVSLPVYRQNAGLVLIYIGGSSDGFGGSGGLFLYTYEDGRLEHKAYLNLWVS